jgi:hypothetical protein
VQRRTVFSIVNVAVAAAAIYVWYRYPQDVMYAIYALFGWFVVSFSLLWVVGGSARTHPAAPTASTASSGGAPVPGARSAPLRSAPADAAPSGPSAPLGFCIYCAADLPADAHRCAACGHAVPPIG